MENTPPVFPFSYTYFHGWGGPLPPDLLGLTIFPTHPFLPTPPWTFPTHIVSFTTAPDFPPTISCCSDVDPTPQRQDATATTEQSTRPSATPWRTSRASSSTILTGPRGISSRLRTHSVKPLRKPMPSLLRSTATPTTTTASCRLPQPTVHPPAQRGLARAATQTPHSRSKETVST